MGVYETGLLVIECALSMIILSVGVLQILRSEIDGLTSEREHERASVEGEHAAALATLKEEQEAVRTPSLGVTRLPCCLLVL